MKKLLVFEYNDSYAGGGLVIIANLDEVEKLVDSVSGDLHVVSDLEQICRFFLQRLPCNTVDGVPEKEFKELVNNTFNEVPEFRDRVLSKLNTNEDDYPGLLQDGKRIRLDWLVDDGFKPIAGIYLVYSLEVPEFIMSKVVSNTYYSG